MGEEGPRGKTGKLGPAGPVGEKGFKVLHQRPLGSPVLLLLLINVKKSCLLPSLPPVRAPPVTSAALAWRVTRATAGNPECRGGPESRVGLGRKECSTRSWRRRGSRDRWGRRVQMVSGTGVGPVMSQQEPTKQLFFPVSSRLSWQRRRRRSFRPEGVARGQRRCRRPGSQGPDWEARSTRACHQGGER